MEDSLLFNYNRARLNWYTIDPSFFGGDSGWTGGSTSGPTIHAPRREQGGVPQPAVPLGTPENLPTLDLTFDPTVRGPYNYLPAEGVGPVPG